MRIDDNTRTVLEAIPQEDSRPGTTPVQRFVEALGTALHRYGAPAHRLERTIDAVTKQLGFEAHVAATPTAIWVRVDAGGRSETTLISTRSSTMHLAHLTETLSVADAVASGTIDVKEGLARLRAIDKKADPYHGALTLLAFAVVSGAAAAIFRGSWREVASATVIGLVIAGVERAARKAPRLNHAYVLTTAFCAGLLSQLLAAALRSAPELALLAGIIVLIPGFEITTAFMELATRHLVAGSARMMGSLMSTMQLGVGAVGGTVVGGWLVSIPMVTPEAPWWLPSVAILPAALSFGVLFKARPREMGAVILAAAVAYGSAEWASSHYGSEMGAFAGALLVGLLGNIYAQWTKKPSATITAPGLILLVPGSIGYRGAYSVLTEDLDRALTYGVSMLTVGVSIAAGLLVAATLFAPKRSM